MASTPSPRTFVEAGRTVALEISAFALFTFAIRSANFWKLNTLIDRRDYVRIIWIRIDGFRATGTELSKLGRDTCGHDSHGEPHAPPAHEQQHAFLVC